MESLLATFSGFSTDNGLKFSASLAYYTVFSLAPLLTTNTCPCRYIFER
jgi:membrane protein